VVNYSATDYCAVPLCIRSGYQQVRHECINYVVSTHYAATGDNRVSSNTAWTVNELAGSLLSAHGFGVS